MFMAQCGRLGGFHRGRNNMADLNVLLAKLLFSETKDEDDAKNIISVIANRLKRPERFGQTLEEVIFAPSQFSGVGSTEWQKAETGKLTTEEANVFKKFIVLSSQFNRGNWTDTTNGADHYANLKKSRPYFSKVYPKTAENKFHTYFKEIPLKKKK
jgi:hypothetical protein